MGGLGMGGPDMGGLILYGACNGGPGIVRNVPNPAQHSTESDFELPSMTKALMNSCLFIVCKTMFTIGKSQAISHAKRTANTRTPNCQSSQGKI